MVDHPILGYGPRLQKQAWGRLHAGGELVYDAVYTFDDNGLRTTGTAHGDSAILLFGGSFTFGEGVSDEDSLPYILGALLAERHVTLNFGFHGYGPHQMLAGLESGMVGRIVSRPVSLVVYCAIPRHIHRAAGMAQWDTRGPRYVLRRSEAVRAGTFDRPVGGPTESSWQDAANRVLRCSALLGRIFFSHLRYGGGYSREQIELFAAIVGRSRDLVQRQYPGARFRVILWDEVAEGYRSSIRAALESRNIEVALVSRIIPDVRDRIDALTVHPRDRHPNGACNRKIAAFIAERWTRN